MLGYLTLEQILKLVAICLSLKYPLDERFVRSTVGCQTVKCH